MMTTAKTIGDGKNEIVMSPGVAAVGVGVGDVGGIVPVPVVDLGYRRGIGDRFDLGVTLTGWGKLAVDGKLNLLGNGKDDKFALAVDPQVGGLGFSVLSVDVAYLDFALPVLLDYAANDSIRLTASPRYRGTYFLGQIDDSGDARLFNYVGTGLGAEFVVNETVVLQPHGTIDYLLDSGSNDFGRSAVVALTGGLALKLRF